MLMRPCGLGLRLLILLVLPESPLLADFVLFPPHGVVLGTAAANVAIVLGLKFPLALAAVECPKRRARSGDVR
jgi:hypothetical protein